MRVLNIAAICGLVAVGCYNPALDDCQFKCGDGSACPAGASCLSGVCRDTTAGTCMTTGSADAAMPREAGVDAPATVSPDDLAVRRAAGGRRHGRLRGAVQSKARDVRQRAHDVPGTDTGAVDVWHLAILDTAAKRTAFGTKLQMSIGWIGLQRTGFNWNWLNGSDEAQAGSGAPWASGEPSANLREQRRPVRFDERRRVPHRHRHRYEAVLLRIPAVVVRPASRRPDTSR